MNSMMDSVHRGLAKQGLVRAERGRWLGGVCAGLAATMKTDPNAVRLIFVIALMIIPGSQFLIYPLLWLAMPDENRAAQVLNQVVRPGAESPAPARTIPAEHPVHSAEHPVHAAEHPVSDHPINDQYPTNQP